MFVSSDEEVHVHQRGNSRKSKRVLDDEDDDVANGSRDPKKPRKDIEHAHTGVPEANDQEQQSRDYHSSKEQRELLGLASPAGLNAARGPKLSERTSKYLFSSSPLQVENQQEEDDEAVKRQKEKLHQKFVKKLGKPDSIADIKRRNKFITEDTPNAEDDADEDELQEDEPTPKPTAKGRKGAVAKKGGTKLTPMERQILDIKRKHIDTILVVEVGYKFRFFGEDARVAAKELGIVCIPGKYRYDERKLLVPTICGNSHLTCMPQTLQRLIWINSLPQASPLIVYMFTSNVWSRLVIRLE